MPGFQKHQLSKNIPQFPDMVVRRRNIAVLELIADNTQDQRDLKPYLRSAIERDSPNLVEFLVRNFPSIVDDEDILIASTVKNSFDRLIKYLPRDYPYSEPLFENLSDEQVQLIAKRLRIDTKGRSTSSLIRKIVWF